MPRTYNILILWRKPILTFWMLCLGLGITAHGQNQYSLYPTIDPFRYLSFSYQIVPGSVLFYFKQIPEEFAYGYVMIQNSRTGCSSGFEISQQVMQNRQMNVDVCKADKSSDTLIISIQSHLRGTIYAPVTIIPGVTPAQINMGENCYELLCEPQNDPWMPNGNLPFFIDKNGYYLNPENGKIITGKRAVESELFDHCDLEYWIYINPYIRYRDKNQVYWYGSTLIKKRKIDMTLWDLSGY